MNFVCLGIWPAHGLGHQVECESGEYFSDDAHAGRFDGEFGAVFVIGAAYFPCGKGSSAINTLEHARQSRKAEETENGAYLHLLGALLPFAFPITHCREIS